jgi:uncharacterized membrane protein YdjX (TVP38/TMEM64 family)
MYLVKKSRLLEQLLLWVGIVAAGLVAWWVGQHYELTELWVKQAGFLGPVVAIGLYALLSLTPIPSDGLTVLCGVVYGWGYGIAISWAGNTVAAMVEYFLFRDVRSLGDMTVSAKKIPKWLRKWPVDSYWFLIGVRFMPGFGGKLVSIMAGMYKVPWWKYLWTAALANLAGSIGYAFVGWGMATSLFKPLHPFRPLDFSH